MTTRYPMTVQGHAALEAELKELKSVKRPDIIQQIAVAREHGDLKENAEYHAAREQQGFIEGRIQDIEGKLSNSQVIDVTAMDNTGKVIFGTTVKLLNLDTDETVTYKIVGVDEADVKKGLLNCTSPFARAIIGKDEGDEVLVRTPNGEVVYEIEQVEYK